MFGNLPIDGSTYILGIWRIKGNDNSNHVILAGKSTRWFYTYVHYKSKMDIEFVFDYLPAVEEKGCEASVKAIIEDLFGGGELPNYKLHYFFEIRSADPAKIKKTADLVFELGWGQN